MAYPLTCIAGFNAPARAGKYEILGFTATVADPTLDSQMAIVDDERIDQTGKAGFIIDSLEAPTYYRNIIVNEKGDGSAYDTVLEWWPSEPVKTRYGLSLCYTNIEQGSLCIYVR